MTNNITTSKIGKEELLKLIDKVSAVQKQDRIIMYFTENHKVALETFFNIKIDSDDCEFNTFYGDTRFIRGSYVLSEENKNKMIFIT